MTKSRDHFGAEELAICLSHYDLGTIFSIHEFARGSRHAPKAVITCEHGKYLFKRRQKGKIDQEKIAFTHEIQLWLAARNFPLPHLLGTKRTNNSMLVLHGSVYEMQEFIEGGSYDGSLLSTSQAGHALGLYHKLLADFNSDYSPPTTGYHNTRAIFKSIGKTRSAISEPDAHTLETIDFLEKTYRKASQSVTDLGLPDWPLQIVHGDWHPGNMLFQNQLVVAVIDYDTARMQPRILDLANGSLQFSILGGGTDPLEWPVHLDLPRFQAFLRGYDEVNVITTTELEAIPFLMCEAMIAEAVLPIATTGGFGRFDGKAFLEMIRQKCMWILGHAETIANILNEEALPEEHIAPAEASIPKPKSSPEEEQEESPQEDAQ